ncbi:MAG: hypothetical protein MMC23_009247 [Stictis urceolatum]|nr:hypothetical protein [Stictis urceolata]
MAIHASKKRKTAHGSPVNPLAQNEAYSAEQQLDTQPAKLCQYSASGSHRHLRVEEMGVQLNRLNQPHGTGTRAATDTSDIFDLQVAELMNKVLPNFESRLAKVDKLLRRVKQTIEDLPARSPLSFVDAEMTLWTQSRIAIPFPDRNSARDAKYLFAYSKPSNVNIIGSVPLRTALKLQDCLTIDMAVTMPEDVFQTKDYLDYRYSNKRAYYLACIAAGFVSRQDGFVECQYDWQNGNFLQPALILSPPKHPAQSALFGKVRVRVLLGPHKALFPRAKLLPWKACSRRQVFESEARTAYALYNGSIQSEALQGSYHKLLHDVDAGSSGFGAAVTLTAVWLRQRGLGTGVQNGGFGSFESAAMIALLMQGGGSNGKPALSTSYSGSQLFRALLNLIATRDLIQAPLVVGSKLDGSPQDHEHSVPMFLDSERAHNILFKMTSFAFARLQHEARLTLSSFDSCNDDAFYLSFIANAHHTRLIHDCSIKLEVANVDPSGERAFGERYLAESISAVCHILRRALGDRLRFLYPYSSIPGPWPTDTRIFDTPLSFHVGLVVDSHHIDRIVDYGPSADETKATASFRNFWGQKSELRRFKDGQILETLVWDQDQTTSVLEQILKYIITRHFGSTMAQSIQLQGQEIIEFLPKLCFQPSRVHAIASRSWKTFESLQQKILSVAASLPLQVRQVMPSNYLYGNVVEENGGDAFDDRHPMGVVIQFESSARWPNDLEAIQRTKGALLLKLGELLKASDPLISSSLGLENCSTSSLNNTYLALVMDDTLFRLRIHHDRELILLNRQLREKKDLTSHERRSCASALLIHKRDFSQSSQHAIALRSLCAKFHLLIPTIQILKLWCSSHLILSHFTSEFLELLAIHTFTSSLPFSTPGNVQTAFLRTLAFVARWDWRHDPLIVNMDEEMSPAEADAIDKQFQGWRRIDPAMNRVVIFAGSKLDTGGIAWTEHKPTKVAATRLAALARAAMKLVLHENSKLKVDILFKPNLRDYDFIIYLNPEYYEHLAAEQNPSKNIRLESGALTSKNRSEPIQCFLEEVEHAHGTSVVLFHDSNSKAIVAGLWNAQLAIRPWKTQMSYTTLPVFDDAGITQSIAPNRTAILSDICRLGKDLIARMDSADIVFK